VGEKWDGGMRAIEGGVTAGVVEDGLGEVVAEVVAEPVAEAEVGILLCNVVGDLVGDASGPVPFSLLSPSVLASFGIGDMGVTGVEGNEV